MDPNVPEGPSSISSDLAPWARTVASPDPVGALLRSAADLDQLERMLLTLAVHPEGVGYDRVQLLLWNERRERMIVWRNARAAESSLPLAVALERARLSGAGLREDGRDRTASHLIALSSLDLVARGAWEEMACRVAPGAGADAPWRPGIQIGAAPLRRGGMPFALMIGEWDVQGADSTRHAALQSWVAMAEDALETCARAEQAQRLTQHSAALAQMAKAAVSPGNLAELLHLLASLAAQATGARGSAVWLAGAPTASADAASAPPRLEVTFGSSSRRERLGRALHPLAASVVATMKPRNIERTTGEMLLSPDAAAAMNACVLVPLVSYGHAHGAFAVYDPVRPHPSDPAGFESSHFEFLCALADLVALAIDQAERFQALREAEQRGRDLMARIRRLERLASLGEMAARTAHEVKSPVASIRGFARRAAHGLADDDPRREYLEIVQREADRIDRVLSEDLDARIAEPPTLALGNLNELVQDALQRAGETLVRRRIRMLKKLSPELPPLLLDGERIRHVLGRMIGSALDAVAIGGRIRIETRRAGQHVLVEIGHDGQREPGEALEQLFVPFANGRSGSPSMGLAVAQRIVHEHGGEIRVRAEGEWSTVIAFTLPIPGNQDRRLSGPDRRHDNADRRKRFPVG